MAGEWVVASLGDLVEIKHGYAFRGEFFRDEPIGDILLTPGNFAIGGGFRDNKFKYYDGPVPNDFVLKEGDLIVTMTDLSKNADTLGFAACVPAHVEGRHFLHNQRLGKVTITNEQAADLGFIEYLMRSTEYRHEIVASATGTTVKHTSPERIKRFRFLLPPLSEQRAIACILGALDDKIELNRRMNRTLEAMARALFQSWFVDFDPVRAKLAGQAPAGLKPEIAALFPDRLVEVEGREAPEGWEVQALPRVMDINPKRLLSRGMVAPYLDMSNMPTQGPSPDTWTIREVGSGMKFVNGDTLVARITPCLENGKTAFVDFLADGQTGWGSTEYIVLRPKGMVPAVFAYILARTESFRSFAIHQMTGSSGRQRVPAASLINYSIVLPEIDSPIFAQFGESVTPMFDRIKTTMMQSRTLAALRDTLLPKLISGALRVPDAERIVGKCM
ncbi:MAG: restriction endonuclease subunit S [Caldilineaceae bacterium]|nr:restriction endonuclease subunit S [Caldilineaceae bacterium]